jgi:hypothetical protein
MSGVIRQAAGFEQFSNADPAAKIEMRRGEVKIFGDEMEGTVTKGCSDRSLEHETLEILAIRERANVR